MSARHVPRGIGVDSRRGRGSARRLRLRPRTCRRRLVRRQRAGRRVVTSDTFGSGCVFESREASFPQLGINLSVLEPGQPNCLYHSESLQEAFLVLSGECRLLVEGEERLLRPWDFFHCPGRDRACLRRRRRRPVRDPHGRCAVGGRAAPLPGLGARRDATARARRRRRRTRSRRTRSSSGHGRGGPRTGPACRGRPSRNGNPFRVAGGTPRSTEPHHPSRAPTPPATRPTGRRPAGRCTRARRCRS